MKGKCKPLALGAIAGFLFWTPGAEAGSVSIALQEAGVNGGAITQQGVTTPNTFSIAGLAYGAFDINNLSGTIGVQPSVLNSNALDQISTAGPGGTLNVYVTASGLTSPLGLVNWSSSFTSNSLTAGWTVTEQTFVSTTDALFTTGTALAPGFTFSSIGTQVQPGTVATGAGPYSVTELYTIVANSAGTANDTIDLSGTAVGAPGPIAGAGLPFLAFGYGAYWLQKRRKTKVA